MTKWAQLSSQRAKRNDGLGFPRHPLFHLRFRPCTHASWLPKCPTSEDLLSTVQYVLLCSRPHKVASHAVVVPHYGGAGRVSILRGEE